MVSPTGGPDGAEQDGVVAAELLQRLVREDGAVAPVAGCPEVEVGGVEIHPGRRHDLEGLGADLGPDAVAADHGHPMPAALVHSCAHSVLALLAVLWSQCAHRGGTHTADAAGN